MGGGFAGAVADPGCGLRKRRHLPLPPFGPSWEDGIRGLFSPESDIQALCGTGEYAQDSHHCATGIAVRIGLRSPWPGVTAAGSGRGGGSPCCSGFEKLASRPFGYDQVCHLSYAMGDTQRGTNCWSFRSSLVILVVSAVCSQGDELSDQKNFTRFNRWGT